MRKRTRSASDVSALVMALILIVPAGSGKATGQDPNESTWDPADTLKAVWTSVEASAMLYNPAQTIQQDPDLARRALTISGEIHVVDLNHVVALSTVPVGEAIAVDSLGHSFRSTPGTAQGWYRPLEDTLQIDPNSQQITSGLEPAHIHLQFNVDPNTQYPRGPVSVSWNTPVVFANGIDAVDMPFVASGRWIQVVPGVMVRIDEAASEGNMASYTVSVEYEKGDLNNPGLPTYLLADIRLLEANGLPLNDMETSFQPAAPTVRRVTVSGSGFSRCLGCGGVKFIQYVFAVLPFEAEVPLTLMDIPVPSLSDQNGIGGR